MTARTHDTAAFTGFAILLLAHAPAGMRLATLCAALLANQLGGIAPDIDQPTAPFWRNLPTGRFFGRIFGRLMGGHRFLSHSLLGFALFGWLSFALLQALHPAIPKVDVVFVWYAFMVGYISHLVLDSFTKEGVPWLLPIPFKFGIPPLKALRITTGTWKEFFVTLPALLLLNVWLCAAYYGDFIALLKHLKS